MKNIIRCQEPTCNKDISKLTQYFDRKQGKVFCEKCNIKEGKRLAKLNK